MATNIGILQYIKSGEISILNEISNIKAETDINIRVKQFFMNSPDYGKLTKEIKQKEEELKKSTNVIRKKHLYEQLNNLLKLEKEFKIDILHMAEVFSKMEIRTKRLRKAKDLFDQGRFKEADGILAEADLSNDHFNLLLLVDYLESRQECLFKKN